MENIGKFRSFRKLNNKQINIPWKLTGVPGCVRTVERILTDGGVGQLRERQRGYIPHLPEGSGTAS